MYIYAYQDLFASCCHNVAMSLCTQYHSHVLDGWSCGHTLLYPKTGRNLEEQLISAIKLLCVENKQTTHAACSILLHAIYIVWGYIDTHIYPRTIPHAYCTCTCKAVATLYSLCISTVAYMSYTYNLSLLLSIYMPGCACAFALWNSKIERLLVIQGLAWFRKVQLYNIYIYIHNLKSSLASSGIQYRLAFCMSSLDCWKRTL